MEKVKKVSKNIEKYRKNIEKHRKYQKVGKLSKFKKKKNIKSKELKSSKKSKTSKNIKKFTTSRNIRKDTDSYQNIIPIPYQHYYMLWLSWLKLNQYRTFANITVFTNLKKKILRMNMNEWKLQRTKESGIKSVYYILLSSIFLFFFMNKKHENRSPENINWTKIYDSFDNLAKITFIILWIVFIHFCCCKNFDYNTQFSYLACGTWREERT